MADNPAAIDRTEEGEQRDPEDRNGKPQEGPGPNEQQLAFVATNEEAISQSGDQKINTQEEDESKEGEEEEEEGECGFCLFMKGGPCRENFINWEKCVQGAEEAKEDIVEKCYHVTLALKECMESSPDYYEPVLQAEKAMMNDAEAGEGEESRDVLEADAGSGLSESTEEQQSFEQKAEDSDAAQLESHQEASKPSDAQR